MFRCLHCAILWATVAFTCLPWSPLIAAAQEPQTDQQKPAADKPAANAAPQTPNATPPVKPRKVITNDDIKSSPFASFGGVFYFSTGSINDCDMSCFDQVRMLSGKWDADKNTGWRRDVLRQIEFVRSDSEWQVYLRQLYDAHNNLCQLTLDKQDELRRSGTVRNVGPQQIDITEKYDQKMADVRAALGDVEALQPSVQKRFADKPFANAFATFQSNRMRSGFCSQWRVIYPQ